MSNVLYKANPAMFRNNPIGFIVCCILCLVVVGFLILLVWWLKTKTESLTVDQEKTVLRKGILSKHVNEVFHVDVRNIKVSQSFLQRMFGVGAVAISSAGQSDVEIYISGMPKPYKIKDLVNTLRKGDYRNGSLAPINVSDQLEKLAKLKADSVLSDEEYETQKAKVMA